jgi:hypothetical protein
MSASPDGEERQVPAPLDVDRLLSGASGIVAGRRARFRARLQDLLDDAALCARLVPPRLERASRRAASGGVHVLGLYSSDFARHMASAAAELERSRRAVRIALGALDEAAPALAEQTVIAGLRGRGKFENLNTLLEQAPPAGARWVLVVDDDVELPRGFLDRLLFLAERFGLQLVQPALRRASHAAWAVSRRERWSVVRRTRMVEIGPVLAVHGSILDEILPFPPLRMGWGLDLHWGGLARERGWRLGVVDAVPIRHEARETASGYDRQSAIEELGRFLPGRAHIDRETALSVIERHYAWPRSDGV